MPPGIHALIVGVDDYRHLPGGSGPESPQAYGMGQLTGATSAARSLADWLAAAQQRLVKPLASCRVLESPTLDDFSAAAAAWREDCASDSDNVALFYYAGHGLERSRSDAVLLMTDFADLPGGNPLKKAVDLNNLFHGMAPTASRPAMATTQLWFVDACLGFPAEFDNFQALAASEVFGIELADLDRRCAPIFFGALPGTSAYGIPGTGTIFSRVLLDSLDGAAAERLPGPAGWTITVAGIGRALLTGVAADPSNPDQQVWIGGQTSGAQAVPLARPAKSVPDVRVRLALSRAAETAGALLTVSDQQGAAVALPNPLQPNPYACRWPAGIYDFALQPPLNGTASEPWAVMPPEFAWEV